MNIGNLEAYGIIYKITNTINNKVYIGQATTTFDRRYSSSGYDSERVYNYFSNRQKYSKKHYNFHLWRAMQKYGYEVFEVSKILDVAFSQIELDIKEKIYISLYNSCDKNFGYNKSIGGKNGTLSLAARRSMSEDVVCLNDGKHYESSYDAGIYYDTNKANINDSCCNYTRGVSINGELYVFAYKKDYVSLTKKDIENRIHKISNATKGSNHSNSREVICLNTNEAYSCIVEAHEKTGCNYSAIAGCCFGKNNRTKTREGVWVTFAYYDEYIKMSDDEVTYLIYKSTDEYRHSLLSESHKGKSNEKIKRKVKCLNTGEVFSSVKEAIDKYGCTGIWVCLKGDTKSSGRHPITNEKLRWEYC